MTPTELTNLLIMLCAPVLMARLIVGTSYEHRTHVLWTFSLPTFAFLLLVVRLTISRNFSEALDGVDDGLAAWLAPLTWFFVIVTQLVAVIYSWWPTWSKSISAPNDPA